MKEIEDESPTTEPIGGVPVLNDSNDNGRGVSEKTKKTTTKRRFSITHQLRT